MKICLFFDRYNFNKNHWYKINYLFSQTQPTADIMLDLECEDDHSEDSPVFEGGNLGSLAPKCPPTSRSLCLTSDITTYLLLLYSLKLMLSSSLSFHRDKQGQMSQFLLHKHVCFRSTSSENKIYMSS